MAGIPSGRVSPFAYGMVPGYDAGTPDTSQPALPIPPSSGAYGTGFLSRLGIGLLGAANPAVAIKAAAPPTLGPQAPFTRAAPIVGDYLRGLAGAQPGSASPGVPEQAPVVRAPVPQTDAPAGLLAPKPVAAPASAVPSDPMLAARSNIAAALANPHINFHQAAALLGGLPRQPMPQETAQNSLLYMAAKQHADETSADALKGLTPDQQKVATINATEKLRRTLESISNANYGALNYEQQGFGLPGTH